MAETPKRQSIAKLNSLQDSPDNDSYQNESQSDNSKKTSLFINHEKNGYKIFFI